jgi:hypothetical protein
MRCAGLFNPLSILLNPLFNQSWLEKQDHGGHQCHRYCQQQSLCLKLGQQRQ